ncbi:MAG: alpha-amylase family glycosyl hydrolase [Oscillospiraceae bacterium]|jgi:alpha-glucosidase|nr:alpha-amylase family glycosyl hydrolase [Oscillospiraceae bacterium]MDD3261868.1 alpha-amylase family glycosyl hydrolase [Oscillospiraceae bacterium]
MPEWLNDAVFYEIYPQSFYDSNGDGIGDINGIAEKLEYIQWLGCNALWINPCFDSPFRDAGYDVRDYKKVAARYGSNEDLYRLFRAAHEKGIHVLLDFVPGHTSEEHPWFRESARPQKNAYSGRYIWTNSAWDIPQPYRFVSGRADRNGSYLINFFSTQPALNYGFGKVTALWQSPCNAPECAATREAMKDVLRFWLDHGCDGFRVDMADSLVKDDDSKKSATGAIWRSVREMLDREYPQAALVSEWSNPQLALSYGFHCDFYLNHPGNGYYTLFRDNENGRQRSFFSAKGKGDITRFLSDYLPKYRNTRKKGFISFITCNHDTPRMSRDFTPRELALAYSFLFLMPGVPFLYYGDEIGMPYQADLVSKEGGYDRTGSRTPMQWNSTEPNAGFSSAPAAKLYLPVDSAADAVSVSAQSGKADSLLETVRTVLRLRHAEPDLQAGGDFIPVYAEAERCPFVFRRGGLLLAFNPSGKETAAPVDARGEILYSLGKLPECSAKKLAMPPQSCVVVRL